jgi:ribose/xylose/arabinose/galactoside ABC-type transport system permease subunit
MINKKHKEIIIDPSIGIIAVFIIVVIIFSLLSSHFLTLSTWIGILNIERISYRDYSCCFFNDFW